MKAASNFMRKGDLNEKTPSAYQHEGMPTDEIGQGRSQATKARQDLN